MGRRLSPGAEEKIIPIILAGGTGTRLWPLSRKSFPKQFLNLLDNEYTMLQKTFKRIENLEDISRPIVICNKEHRFIVGHQMKEINIDYSWSGNTGFTFNQLPHVGRNNKINYAMGFCGSGTVLSPYLGYKVGYQTMGDKRGATAYSSTNLKLSPLNFFSKPYFLNFLDIWTRLKSW